MNTTTMQWHVHAESLRTVDPALLRSIAEKALGRPVIALGDWQVEPLGTADASTQAALGGIYRIHGQAIVAGQHCAGWSAVVKVLKSPAGAEMPGGIRVSQALADDSTAFGYWQREALLFRSGLLDRLPKGLMAPRCFAVEEVAGVLRVWQEEVKGHHVWRWNDYHDAAHQLGCWQADYITGCETLPKQTWLSHDWLRRWTDVPVTKMVEMFDASMWQHPLIADNFTTNELQQVQRLWEEREETLAALAALPQTFCHLDVHQANMFRRQRHGRRETVLIDWSFAGRGALGEEMGAFVAANLLLNYIDVAEVAEFERMALDGYLAGLRAGGWAGKASLIWQGYRCSAPLRYVHLSLASIVRTAFDTEFAQQWEQKEGRPLAELIQQRTALVRYLLDVYQR